MTSSSANNKKSYIIITPAKNEELFIGNLIEAVISQTVLPVKWILVSDNSTDKTDNIILQYEKKYDFINLIRNKSDGQRSFSSKAHAFNAGYQKVSKLKFDFIGNLDADVTFEPLYYEKIIEEMEKDPQLGIAGGVIFDKTNDTYKRCVSNLNHAPGAVQFFRRECYECIGGYQPVSSGGIDSIAELIARMNGWKTKSFSHLHVYHHKPVGTGGGKGIFTVRCREGFTEYNIGTHPLFAIAKAVRRIKERPFIIGSVIRILSYFYLMIRRTKRDIPEDAVDFVHQEQINRLKLFFIIKK